jgi:hypothetical protein
MPSFFPFPYKVPIAAILFALFFQMASAQSSYLPAGHYLQDFTQRMEIRTGMNAPGLHTSMKPYERKALTEFITTADSAAGPRLSRTDRQIIKMIQQQNPEWHGGSIDSSARSLFGRFYNTPYDFYRYLDDELFLSINPVIYAEMGKDNQYDGWIYRNTRGIEARGMINRKVGFYSYLSDNQAVFPIYVKSKIAEQRGAIPGYGWNIPFGQKGYDFFDAHGYIAFQATRNIGFQFGQDKNFFGNGMRSLLLSNYSNHYLFFKINTQIWRFHYQNIFARMVDYPHRTYGGRIYDPKYMASHTLSINLSQRFQLGFFENVIFGRSDKVSRRTFDAHYLNPVIFYRAVEHHIGDPDKVALGMNWRWIMGRSLSWHGQVYIDDFLMSDVRNDVDSIMVRWGLRSERKYSDYASFLNKFAFQTGITWVDVLGVSNLDFRVEGNWVRPFTYSHYDTSGLGGAPAASYSHYGQALAHPLGANFREYLFSLQYQPHRDIIIRSVLMNAVQGRDSAGINLGGNIFRDYTTRRGDYGHLFLQGIQRNIFLIDNRISWQWRPGMWLDLQHIYRIEEESTILKSSIFTAGIRINAVKRDFLF